MGAAGRNGAMESSKREKGGEVGSLSRGPVVLFRVEFLRAARVFCESRGTWWESSTRPILVRLSRETPRVLGSSESIFSLSFFLLVTGWHGISMSTRGICKRSFVLQTFLCFFYRTDWRRYRILENLEGISRKPRLLCFWEICHLLRVFNSLLFQYNYDNSVSL